MYMYYILSFTFFNFVFGFEYFECESVDVEFQAQVVRRPADLCLESENIISITVIHDL